MNKIFTFGFVLALGTAFAQDKCESFCSNCLNDNSPICVAIEADCGCAAKAAEKEAAIQAAIADSVAKVEEAARLADSIAQIEIAKTNALKEELSSAIYGYCKSFPCEFEIKIRKQGEVTAQISEIQNEDSLKVVADSLQKQKSADSLAVAKKDSAKVAPKNFKRFVKNVYGSFGLWNYDGGLLEGYTLKEGSVGYTFRYMFLEFLGIEAGLGLAIDYSHDNKSFSYNYKGDSYDIWMLNRNINFDLEIPLMAKIGGGKYHGFLTVEELFRKPVASISKNTIAKDGTVKKGFNNQGFDIGKWEFETFVGVGAEFWRLSLQYSLMLLSFETDSYKYETLNFAKGFKVTLSYSL